MVVSLGTRSPMLRCTQWVSETGGAVLALYLSARWRAVWGLCSASLRALLEMQIPGSIRFAESHFLRVESWIPNGLHFY